MGFLTSNRLSQSVDRALPRIKTSLMKCNPRNQPEDSLLPLLRKKTSAESEIEDIDLDMQLKLAQRMSDESNDMWLSSDCDSSSLLSSDISGDPLCQWKSGNPESSLHDLQIDLSGEHSKEEGVLNDQSVCCHESRGFSYDRFLEDSSIYESSCTSLSTMDDLDRNGTWISTFDLNLESTELIQLEDDGVTSTYSDFSSLLCSYRRNPQSESSFSSPSSVTSFNMTETSSCLSSEFDHDEPLFWPYNQNLYESSELGKSFLCVSPRKEKKMAGNKLVNELKSVEVKLKKTNIPASRKSIQLQCGRRPELNQTPKKSVAPTRKKYNNSQLSPSQLSTSLAQASAKLFTCNNLTNKRNNSTMKVTPKLKSKNQRNKEEELPKKPLLEFEASFFREVFIKGATIEEIVGLNEFDGLEWLNFDFSEDFLLNL